jgi:hypothetical protein
MQEALMRNPIVGLFMTEAAIASEIVRSITLDDRNRDYTKEQRDGLEETKKNLDEREISRKVEGVRMPWDIAKAQEERDREQREKVEKAIEENKKRKAKEREKEEERKREKDRSPFERDSWGRW